MKKFIIYLIPFFLIACGDSPQLSADIVKDEPATTIDTLKILVDAIKTDPNIAENWANRADYFFGKGSLDNARRDYEEAVLLDSNNTEYRTKYGNILIGYLELEGAKFNFEWALRLDSLNADALVGLGKIYAFIDNPAMATVYLNKAYNVNPYLPEAYFLEGLIYKDDFFKTKREESWNRSKSSFQTAIEQKPDYYSAYVELGIMNDIEDNDIALDYFNSALDIAPESSEAWYNKGMFYQKRDQYSQAKTCYRTILVYDSTNIDAHYNQGFLQLMRDNDYDSAIYFYEKLIDIDSLSYRAYNDLGLAYEFKNEKSKAIMFYEKALAINPDFETAQKNLKIVKQK